MYFYHAFCTQYVLGTYFFPKYVLSTYFGKKYVRVRTWGKKYILKRSSTSQYDTIPEYKSVCTGLYWVRTTVHDSRWRYVSVFLKGRVDGACHTVFQKLLCLSISRGQSRSTCQCGRWLWLDGRPHDSISRKPPTSPSRPAAPWRNGGRSFHHGVSSSRWHTVLEWVT